MPFQSRERSTFESCDKLPGSLFIQLLPKIERCDGAKLIGQEIRRLNEDRSHKEEETGKLAAGC